MVVFAYNRFSKINDTLLIPSISDLKIVELRPGEATGLNDVLKTNRYMEEIRLKYSIANIFGNRFENWFGTVISEPIKVKRHESCKL